MQALAVERSSAEGVDFLAVEGEIDLATSPRLIAVLNDAVADAQAPLVVDLSGVAFMDSTGIALLLNAHRRVRRRGLGFAVVCPPGPLHRVFEISDMVDTLDICPDLETAIAVAARRRRRFI
ncbi:MAG TPA: STAS domain-containing protein [Thermoleophilaceae bacterium]|nr:STAS domain-containing protein [Thermoleophilaceae bacterium]